MSFEMILKYIEGKWMLMKIKFKKWMEIDEEKNKWKVI